jgi:hypothetical protein
MDYGAAQLGEVAAKLVELEFKDDIGEEDAAHVARLLRLARSLHAGIQRKLERVQGQVVEGQCGTCIVVPSSAKAALRTLVAALEAGPRADVMHAYKRLRSLNASKGRKLCDLVGTSCSALEKEYQVDTLQSLEEEARRVVKYAEHVSQSYVFQLEAQEETFDLRGGDTVFRSRLDLLEKDSNLLRRVAKQFYRSHVPDFGNTMVVALDAVTSPHDIMRPLLQHVHPSRQQLVKTAYDQRWRDFLSGFNLYSYKA